MKRDMELIRRILLGVESGELGDRNFHKRVFDDIEHEFYFYHIKLLDQAGLLECISFKMDNLTVYYPLELTWNGHEFLDTIRNDKVWAKVKSSLSATMISSAPYQVISGLGLAALKSALGL